MIRSPLSDVAQVIRGVTFSKAEGSETPSEDRVPVIRAGSIQEELLLHEGRIWVPAEKVKPNQKIRNKDIIMCTSSGSAGLVGKCARAIQDWEGTFGAFCAGIRANEAKCNPSYLFHFLRAPSFRTWAGSSSGANIKNIRASELASYKIPLPPLAEQKRIAGILDAADALRAKRRESLAQLDALVQSVFLDMFGDPVTNPKGWEIKTLGEAANRVTDGTHQSPKWSDSGIPFLFVSNIRDRQIDFQTSKFISESEYERLTARCPIEVGDILYTTVGSYGNPAMVRKDIGRFAFQRHIAHIKPNSELVDSKFLEIMLDSPVGRNQADRLARGVAQKTLNLRELKGFRIFLPPIAEQRRFAAIIERVEQNIVNSRTHLSELDRLFASLQSQAFNGEL